MDANADKSVPPHHVQQELCTTRPLYRQGRKLTAVKVYTVNSESQHLVVYGVPGINLRDELHALCVKYGDLKDFKATARYETEEFTECFHVQYKRIQSARIAKRFLDNKSFYGGVLHVCYAPELENVSETREKIKQRQKDVLSRLQPGPSTLEYVNYQPPGCSTQQNRKRKYPAIAITEDRLRSEGDDVWDNIPSALDPRLGSAEGEAQDKTGFKKHFQYETAETSKGVQYGPYIPDHVDVKLLKLSSSETSPAQGPEKRNVRTTLLPTAVLKRHRSDCNRIVFRKK